MKGSLSLSFLNITCCSGATQVGLIFEGETGDHVCVISETFTVFACDAAFGLPSELYLQSDRTGLDAAQTCKVLHALIKQRQRDVERGRDAHERLTRLAHDLKIGGQQREKLAQRLAAKERELGALENRVSGPYSPALQM